MGGGWESARTLGCVLYLPVYRKALSDTLDPQHPSPGVPFSHGVGAPQSVCALVSLLTHPSTEI